jgi:hypothetical protein
MIEETMEKDSKVISCGIRCELSRIFTRRVKESHETPQSVQAVSRPRFETRTSRINV